MCRVLSVKPLRYYDWINRDISDQQIHRNHCELLVRVAHSETHEHYGIERLHTKLIEQVQGAEMVAITTVNDQMVDKSVGINYFTLELLVFHGFTSDVGEYSIATQTKPIPKIARLDDSSTYLTEQVYSDSSKHQKLKT